MFKFLPKNEVFFDLFREQGDAIKRGVEHLQATLDDFTNVNAKLARMKEIEHEGDHITHQTFEHLNKTFVTPIDGEEIHALAKNLDDVLDIAHGAFSLLVLYKVEAPTEPAKKLVAVLVKSVEKINEALELLPRLKKENGPILELCIEINRLENEGDVIFHEALGELFDGKMDAIEIIKWKDIYQTLELATDKCEDLANIFEAIVLKNA